MPNVTVAAIITRIEDGIHQILLTKRSNNLMTFPGSWVLPGGHVDQYETREQAVIREVKEETGLDFLPTLFGAYDEIFEQRGIHAVVTVYAGTCDGELVSDEHEVAEAGWYSFDDALSPTLELGFEHRKIITDYVNFQNRK